MQAPADANLAPPGDYMLFIVNGSGVPSVASFVRFAAAEDTTTADRAGNLAANAARGPGLAHLDGLDRQRRRHALQRPPRHDGRLHADAANRIAQPTGTSYTDTGLTPDVLLQGHCRGRAGNIGPASNEASATVAGERAVAAYGFDAGSRDDHSDQSGNGNNGTLGNTTWAGATAGRFGNALSFNGTNAYVTVPDSASLDLTNGMTLETWVRPTTLAAAGGR